MLISLLFAICLTAAGLPLTYIVTTNRPLIWRLAAGNIVGSAIFGTCVFVLACLFGFSVPIVLASLVITLGGIALFLNGDTGRRLSRDWAKARGQLQGGGKRFGGFLFYGFFLVLFCLFFSQALYQTPQGIFTGGSQNFGDLPFHLGTIFSFTDAANFPPQNPSYAGAKFSYPFIADLLTAAFMRVGADVQSAMFVQDVTWAFSLLVLLEGFVVRLTSNKLAGRIAVFLLFLTGGLGFVWFLKDFWEQSKGITDFLWAMPRDYTIGDQFRWGNSMVVLFITQRSLLLGMPLTIIVLGWLWRTFAGDSVNESEHVSSPRGIISPFIVGLFAGTLPLIHLHSLAVLFAVTGFCLILKPLKWSQWVAFGVGVTIIAVPELIWSMAGTATETTQFFGWHFGWDKGNANFFWFWIKNTGIAIPLIAVAAWLYGSGKVATKPIGNDDSERRRDLLYFYTPFVFLFLVSNIAKLAPWEWDNIKVLIYWYVGSLPLIASAIAWAWQRKTVFKITAAACFVSMIFAGSLDVFRTVTSQNKAKVFDADAVKIADLIRAKTPPNAVFLNDPTFNTAVVLSGRLSFMRYAGHLASHGIDYRQREKDVKMIYQGGGVVDLLLKKNGIDYVLISPAEVNDVSANEEFFQRYPLIAESGQYRVYQVK